MSPLKKIFYSPSISIITACIYQKLVLIAYHCIYRKKCVRFKNDKCQEIQIEKVSELLNNVQAFPMY